MEPSAIHELLAAEFGEAILAWHDDQPEPWADVAPARVADVARFLRDDPRCSFDMLMCLSGIDWDGLDESGKGKSVEILGYEEDGTPQTGDRVAEGDLGVAYHLYSHGRDHKFSLRVRLPRAEPTVPTVALLWPTAAWHEREAFDLVGVRFEGHPDPRRILLDDAWVGHPLRKDYQMPGRWEGIPLQGQPYARNPHRKEGAGGAGEAGEAGDE